MGELTERIDIKQLRNTNQYLVTRLIEERVMEEDLAKIAKDIDEALKNLTSELEKIPVQAETRTKELVKQERMLRKRMQAFGKYLPKEVNPAAV